MTCWFSRRARQLSPSASVAAVFARSRSVSVDLDLQPALPPSLRDRHDDERTLRRRGHPDLLAVTSGRARRARGLDAAALLVVRVPASSTIFLSVLV